MIFLKSPNKQKIVYYRETIPFISELLLAKDAFGGLDTMVKFNELRKV